MLGSGPAPGRRTGAGATGARSRSPFRRLGSPPRTPPSPSPAASRRPGLCPDSAFPPSLPQETKGGFSRVIARPPRGRLSGPQRGRPPHKGTPRAGSPCRRARPRPARELSPTCSAHGARSCRCPEEVWTDPTTHTRAGAWSPHPDRCGTHDLCHLYTQACARTHLTDRRTTHSHRSLVEISNCNTRILSLEGAGLLKNTYNALRPGKHTIKPPTRQGTRG
ncbi:PREDICTED: basic salivary proline-rich protein 1-like [Hipposideros armiger]|uniref:Basic salivary proline-rich protein 1-like n=1 Tax=Hipposideros armiger TaxID=186990 RepID=A0A8B7QRY1_HIPAR|nr:PREDICTED: basic salivary proline-rich protein 1-like [Hipposideros armiger]